LCGSQRKLEGVELFAVFPNALGQKHTFRNRTHLVDISLAKALPRRAMIATRALIFQTSDPDESLRPPKGRRVGSPPHLYFS
jgi:hypothetical protein